MSAQALLAEVWDAGIVIRANGGRLHIEAKPGTVTAELRERLAASKADLIPLLQETDAMRAHLLELAKLERLPADLVQHLHDDDLLAIPDDYTDRNLTAYLRELLAAKEMDAGAIPESWGGAIAAMCEGCGPVLLHPTSPTHLKACPWCFRRKAGKAIPRPHG